MSTVFKALADPTRRRVLELLRRGPLTAGELAEHFEFSKPTMSAHFAVLRALYADAGWRVPAQVFNAVAQRTDAV